MPIRLDISGLQRLQGELKLLQQAVQEDATRQSVKAAGDVISAEEKVLAPVLDHRTAQSTALPPGALKHGIGVKMRRTVTGTFTAFIGPKRGTGRAAHLVEYGHWIIKGGKSRVEGGSIVGPGYVVGYAPAHPFLRPAFDAKWQAALAAFNESLKQLLKDWVR